MDDDGRLLFVGVSGDGTFPPELGDGGLILTKMAPS